MSKLSLVGHPRLYLPSDVVADMAGLLHSPVLEQEAKEVVRDAKRLVRQPPLGEEVVERDYQPITRAIDSYLQCLTAAWLLTREQRYRDAAMKHLGALAGFTHISCEARFNSDPDQEFLFCLTYGELSASVAVLYDVISPDITPSERETFHAVLHRHLMKQAVRCLEEPPWWANMKGSYWNGVCAGGMGMLALAFYDDYPEAANLLAFVETSLTSHFETLVENGGGWPQGTGPYSHGMNYAIRYLLSWEHATGNIHPLLELKEVGKSLHFPLDFAGLTFGETGGWCPAAWPFLLAKRLGRRKAALHEAAYCHSMGGVVLPLHASRSHNKLVAWHMPSATSGDLLHAASAIPEARELETLKQASGGRRSSVVRIYKGMGWGSMRDDGAFPTLRMVVRGGMTSCDGNTMQDQLSFKCMVNGETMITEQEDRPAVAFTKRGKEVFGRSAASKSTLFLDGLGSEINSDTDMTEIVKAHELIGIRVDGSTSYLHRWRSSFIGRLFLFVDSRYWLVLDRAFWPDPAMQYGMESRFHTFATTACRRRSATLTSGSQHLTMSFAALGGCVLREATGLPTYPIPETRILRWISAAPANEHFHVTALNPGTERLELELLKERRRLVVRVTEPGGRVRDVAVSAHLRLH